MSFRGFRCSCYLMWVRYTIPRVVDNAIFWLEIWLVKLLKVEVQNVQDGPLLVITGAVTPNK